MNVFELLALLEQQQHTGPVTLHLLHGVPKKVDVPRQPQRFELDTRRVSAVNLTP